MVHVSKQTESILLKGEILPSVTPAFFLVTATSTKDIEAMLASLKNIDPLLESLHQTVNSKIESVKTLDEIPQLDKAEIVKAIQQLPEEKLNRLQDNFTAMIHALRTDTEYFKQLETFGIPEAIESNKLFSQAYRARIKFSFHVDSSGGSMTPFLRTIAIDVLDTFGVGKDTLLHCLPELASTGRLPNVVGILAHELHHYNQHRVNIFDRIWDTFPTLLIADPFPWLRVDRAACELSAYLLENLQPSNRINAPREILQELTHEEFSSYQFDRESTGRLLPLIQYLLFLGISESEMSKAIADTRFKGYGSILKHFLKIQDQRRAEKGLEDDTCYEQYLALTHANNLCDAELLRHQASTRARSLLDGIL